MSPSAGSAGPAPPAPRPEVDVLVVDDRAEQRLAIEAVISELDVSVFTAGSAREALRLLLRRDFALLLLDVQMPDIDGFELAELVRGRPRSARTPIIFLTAGSEFAPQAARGYALGAVDFIHAPVLPEVLKAKVSVLAELHRKTEQVRRSGEDLRELEAREHRRRLDEAMEKLQAEARQVEVLRQEQRQAAAAQKLAAASLALHAAGSLDDALETIARQAAALLGATRAIAWIRDDSTAQGSRSRSVPVEELSTHPETQSAIEDLLSAAAAHPGVLQVTGDQLERLPDLAPSVTRLASAHRPRQWLSVPLAGRDQSVLGVLAVCDPTLEVFTEDDVQLASSLAEVASSALQDLMFREAREANRIKDEFLAVLSHELRTPLSAMTGWTHLLRTGRLDERDHQRAIEIIDRNLKVQTQLIDDLLDMSRIVTGKLRLEPAALVLPPLVAGAVDAQRPAALAKSLRFDADLDPAPVCVWGDSGRLEQVVGNLLSNAIKFTPEGGSVRVTLRRTESVAEIRIEDSGEGIDPELLPHVFDRFTQAESSTSRSHGGLGLGLTIVKRLIELHGGAIRAESPGKGLGSCFAIRLPVFDGDPTSQAAASAGQDGDVSLAGVRVLVVDDDADAREMVATAFADAGAHVLIAASAAAALAEIDRRVPDVLVSDISMPEEDGYSLMRRVRARGFANGASIPAIALTALAEHRHHTASLEAGFQIFLTKPVNLGHLLRATAALVPSGRAPGDPNGNRARAADGNESRDGDGSLAGPEAVPRATHGAAAGSK